MKHLNLFIMAMLLSVASFATIAPIAGPTTVCVGTTQTLTDASPGGMWTTSSMDISLDMTTGVVTGVSTGVADITYTVGPDIATYLVTVYPTPSPIVGPVDVCEGSFANESCATPGTWSISPLTVATIGATTGVVTGLSPGTATIINTDIYGCMATMTVTVHPAPAPITGTPVVCSGGTTALHSTTPGGAWASATPAIATIGSLGIATGVYYGVATIIYAIPPYGCSSTMTLTVTATSAAHTMTGTGAYCAGTSGAVLGLSGSDVGVSYQLFLGGTPVGTPVMGTGAAISFGAQTVTGVYTVAGNGGTPCAVTMPGSVTVAATPLPTVFTVTSTGTACGDIALTGSEPGVTYQLFTGTSPVGTPIAGTGGAISFGPQSLAGLYDVVATNSSTGCTNNMAGTVTLTGGALPFVYSLVGGSYCAGGGGVAVNLASSDPGVNYSLFNGTSLITTMPGTGSSISFGAMTGAGTYTVQAVNASTGCASTSGPATVTVSALPAVYGVTGGGPYCGGPAPHVGVPFTAVGVIYQLYIGGIAVGTPIAGTGAAIDFGTFTTPGTYMVQAVSAITGCINTMGSVTITAGTPPATYGLTGGSYCSGGMGIPVVLANSDAGVSYSLYMGTTLVGTMAGTGGPLSFGPVTTAGSYTVEATTTGSGCTSTTSAAMVTLSPPPAAYIVTGGGSYCAGGTGAVIGLAGSQAGVSYQLFNGGTSTGSPIAGTGLAISFGAFTAAGVYTVIATNTGSTCASTMTGSATVAITASTVPTIALIASPGTSVCAGTVVTYNSSITGGGSLPTYSWTVNGTAVTGTGSSYTYTPATGDVVEVTMTSTATCAMPATVTAAVTMTVSGPAVTATSTTGTCGGLVTLSAAGGVTYSWSPSTGLSCAACTSPTLIPATTTTYTVTGVDGSGCTGTATVTVDANRIYGHISYTGTSSDSFKVWLVQFNPADSTIAAEDSMYSCMDAGVPYYEFDSKPAGDYLVKAKLTSAVPGTSGYMPTYGLSNTQWDSATTIVHTTAANVQNITMVYGTVPAGPGFISGYVVSGAGKGTSGDIAAAGMTIYLKNAAGHTVTYTTTASDGTYHFAGIAHGTYVIYPEAYKYYTTASATITLAPGTDTAKAINFKQHTGNGRITPIDRAHVDPLPAGSSLGIYPNPAGGVLNVSWTDQATGTATVTITDITGRTVATSTLVLGAASGSAQVDLSGISDGVYMISVKSATLNYNSKLIKTKQ